MGHFQQHAQAWRAEKRVFGICCPQDLHLTTISIYSLACINNKTLSFRIITHPANKSSSLCLSSQFSAF